jgi:hypothetical protein
MVQVVEHHRQPLEESPVQCDFNFKKWLHETMTATNSIAVFARPVLTGVRRQYPPMITLGKDDFFEKKKKNNKKVLDLK